MTESLFLVWKKTVKTLQNVFFCVSQIKKNTIWIEFRYDTFIFRSVKSDLHLGHSMVSSLQTLHQEILSL